MEHQAKMTTRILIGDCIEQMRGLESGSVDAVVTDPPYELGFMGKKWDASGIAYNVDMWKECFRVLKPGGHLLSFGGSRTYHRMACAIEDAGFDIRDMIEWVYGSGFPKSLDVSKAIDKAAGVERTEIIGKSPYEGRRPNDWGGNKNGNNTYGDYSAQPEMPITAPATEAAKQWDGFGTAAKPAHEPIIVCTKPLTLENVYAILSLEITENLRRHICQKSSVSAEDAEKILKSILLILEKAGANTVAEGVKTYVWENTESVSIAAVSSMLHGRILKEQTGGNKEGSVPEDVKVNGNGDLQEKKTPTGKTGHLFGPMAMLQLMLEGTTIDLNTLSLWKNTLDGLLSGAKKTSTIGTALKTITELKTLNSYLSVSISGFTCPSLTFAPNHEPICLARKPLTGTVAENVLKHGCGGLNIDQCRIETSGDSENARKNKGNKRPKNRESQVLSTKDGTAWDGNQGRWPANFCHDGSDEVVGLFPVTTSGKPGIMRKGTNDGAAYGTESRKPGTPMTGIGDSGSAARFFFCAKASKQDRDEGLDGTPEHLCGMMEDDEYPIKTGSGNLRETKRHNNHPTVKPHALMRWLCRLVTPPNGTILDPFMGSGSTGKAAIKEGFSFIGIELDPEYAEIARKRIEAVKYIPKAKVLPRYREQEEVRRKPQQQEMF